MEQQPVRVALLWRGDPRAANAAPAADHRLYPVFQALGKLGISAEPVVYGTRSSSRFVIACCNATASWYGWTRSRRAGDRRTLDPMLRSVAAQGVWVSAHPDVILKMGTKDVIFRTRALSSGHGDVPLRSARRAQNAVAGAARRRFVARAQAIPR